MKLKQILMGGLFAALMASCSNDLPDPNDGKVLENETTTYVRLSIGGDMDGTRDGEVEEPGYQYGTADESKVNSVLLTFYDHGRNFVGKTTVNIKEGTLQEVGTENTVESKLTFVAKVTLPENISYPKYVVAYVNPTTASADLGTEKLEDAMGIIRTRESVSPKGRTMNNSVYFDATGTLKFATEVDFEKQFFPSEDEAKKADAPTIEITVERMEAKVCLNPLGDITISDFKTDIDGPEETGVAKYSLKFVPEAWFVNALEKRSFLLKNYRTMRKNYTESMSETESYRLSDLNRVFTSAGQTPSSGSFTVNDLNNQRSYWAIDPTYFYSDVEGTVYPDVSYDIAYPGTDNETTWTGSNNDWGLHYRSYKDAVKEYRDGISTNTMTFVGDSKRKSHEYVLENTMSNNTLRGNHAKASMTSVVILGHYIITDNEGNEVFNGEETNTVKGFYVRHDADGRKYVMLSQEEAIDYFLEHNTVLYTPQRDQAGNIIMDENNKPKEFEAIQAAHLKENMKEGGVDYQLSRADFQLSYPANAGNIQSEQWRTLNFRKTANKYNENIYVYSSSLNGGKGGYITLNELAANAEDLHSFNERLYANLGVIEKFQSGKAYFNVPLKHIWGDLASSNNTFEPDKVAIGDYGVVRNHIYDLTINSISGLGTGIGDINQPIVPPTENKQYYVSTRLNILKWRLVNQHVDL
ncbi:MAG: fimbria major subunit [Muribaculaceae bacterium]|nr:fimbria major subunit [Muribaculaceae bacterium]